MPPTPRSNIRHAIASSPEEIMLKYRPNESQSEQKILNYGKTAFRLFRRVFIVRGSFRRKIHLRYERPLIAVAIFVTSSEIFQDNLTARAEINKMISIFTGKKISCSIAAAMGCRGIADTGIFKPCNDLQNIIIRIVE